MSKASNHKLDIDNLDFKHIYTFEEFESINEQLKTHTLKIDGNPVNLFEFHEGKLLPMSQNSISKEAVVCEISRQLCNWNVYTRQNGIITTSQGGFNFGNSDQRTICAPDVAFIPKNIYRSLDHQQQWTFKGQSFTPTFVVEVAVVQEGYQEYNDLDKKFREIYLRQARQLALVDGGSILPGFILKVQTIDDTISQEYSESSSSESDGTIDCPKCSVTFSNNYDFMKHFENSHARRWHLKNLDKVPNHLAVLFWGEIKEKRLKEAAQLCCWAWCSGIKVLSIYDVKDDLKNNAQLLQSYIDTFSRHFFIHEKFIPIIRVTALGVSTKYSNNESSNLPDLQVNLISYADGRTRIVEVAKNMAEDVMQGKMKSNELDAEELDRRLIPQFSEPQLLILFSPKIELEGFPPWHIHLTEIL
ncbi:13231_t:CDS:2 [Cetraspora pellucida]|uniref:ditrans,polycis-polyprenyl diphosphate synthase [(2E,6E)-farnesyldiphosphate specific] n=1 Tax=Cetraspora pellucida TaxID=1433469 RepID=A0A9N9GHZ4_9GLOM|nr:13231_t:CDS:2 [Cetraspora pellucida]